uniref:NADH-ubiquinone oxidoreductase chain 3 n=1 Tax=Tetrahymena thermophila TaxID=5911 RepID=Q950Z7_TETTH|nr:NADH dehydrogenase subunit 3 [Tetrahymena thermophila]7TGH_3 Chain 3, NADH-ubiquinone oxidoreductase chain 3 [Tetrahymena thermophila]8B6F_AX Chain AX, NADH-ubiquinone oxidoreductase chain 3 [Tetrahymena thermophila SB210]8BQS_AX Chain AX, NADH-ubiquinone oxidoreductase chain 3 [Tetrahymena thermophila SB210]8GYM_N3 Chain N3, NADH-ubiquinone oxidoreductase chain 3 [Tetrahymena thermophila SB210]8GYM_n3 Chain n3, NADH-ubiquinone oxidoreductase chain 3 [Tetrahymena thermophila SB210]8GZU_N3 
MGDAVVIHLIQNVLIFGIIFWLLTWGAEYFYTVKQQLTKKQFYECGFKSISELNIQINFNFFMLAVFLILYDVEFTFLFPVLFNFSMFSTTELFLAFFFIFLILVSLLYDWLNNVLSWSAE